MKATVRTFVDRDQAATIRLEDGEVVVGVENRLIERTYGSPAHYATVWTIVKCEEDDE